MTGTEAFDTVVIGAGQAGPFLAAKLVAQGRRVALIESRDLGGTCVNRGCTPTKTLRKSARVAYMARRAAEFGVRVGPVEVDFAAAMQRMKQRVDESRAGLQSWLGGLEGLTIIKAHGRLAGRNEAGFVVEADQRRLAAPKVVLNTGTRPYLPPIAIWTTKVCWNCASCHASWSSSAAATSAWRWGRSFAAWAARWPSSKPARA